MTPKITDTFRGHPVEDVFMGRKLDCYNHNTDAKWGYAEDQIDTFSVLLPKDYDSAKKYPLYVVFHSAGHDMYTALICLLNKGNHDIYHVPDDMIGLFLDCCANAHVEGTTDWFWGGRHAQEPEISNRSGLETQPVEKRVLDEIDWVMNNYPVDRERVYAVGNSMGGTGSLGVCLCRGDIFAALKVNVAAGVYHAMDRCGFESKNPEGFEIPDCPVVVDYSAHNDVWSTGHSHLYRAMRDYGYQLFGFWGEFGHENNHEKIAEYNDIIEAFNPFELKLHEAYPAFANASTDNIIPWSHDLTDVNAGQVNGYFRWKVLKDTADEFEIELRLLRQDEWQSRWTFPTSSTADVTLRRLQNFKVAAGDKIAFTFGDKCGEIVSGKAPKFDKLEITAEPKVLTLRHNRTITG